MASGLQIVMQLAVKDFAENIFFFVCEKGRLNRQGERDDHKERESG